MEIINSTDFHINDPTAISIGKFDGVHLGHQKLIRQLVNAAHSKNLKAAVFTFNIFPEKLLGNSEIIQISTAEDRMKNLEFLGIDYLIEYPFDSNLAATDAGKFIKDVLIGKCNMKLLVGGDDISFGHNRTGNISTIGRLSEEYGFDYLIIEKIKNSEGNVISSELIRKLLSEGKTTEANALLNHSSHQ